MARATIDTPNIGGRRTNCIVRVLQCRKTRPYPIELIGESA